MRIKAVLRDPGSDAFLTPGSGYGMNIPDNIFESLETVFWVTNSLMRIRIRPWTRDGKIKIRDPG
jgi:hypothetical protein